MSPLHPRTRRLARAVLPAGLEPWARELADRRGWTSPRPSPDDDPFQYPFWEILSRGGWRYPQYVWGTMCGASLAAALGIPRISVIEFGVAGGNGLLELERNAAWVERRSGVAIDVFGFDTGSGLPRPVDYRDVPNLWSEGFYAMDVDRLRDRLSRARLFIGPVAETVPEFLADHPAPVAFVSVDLDLYSSTKDALVLFDAAEELLLPRITCYFDDIVGFSHGDFTGERLAIREFNDEHTTRKISQLYGLRWVTLQERRWTDQMYMVHLFENPAYNLPDGTNRHRELPLNAPEPG